MLSNFVLLSYIQVRSLVPITPLGWFDDLISDIVGGVVDALLDPLEDLLVWLIALLVVNFIMYPIAVLLWQLDRLLIFIGLLFAIVNEAVIDYVFTPTFTILAERFRFGLLPLVFTIVVGVLGITYVLAAWYVKDTNLVDWKKALAWLLGAIIFYGFGVDLFISTYQVRQGFGSIMYSAMLGLQEGSSQADVPSATEVFGVLAGADVGDAGATSALCNQYGPTGSAGSASACQSLGTADILNYDIMIDGLDIATSYVVANHTDVTGSIDLPVEFKENFFDGAPGVFGISEGEERLEQAAYGLQRLFFGVFVIAFAIVEQYVHLIITLGMGVIFFLMLWAVLLGFFNHTEFVARSLIKMWFNMMMTSMLGSVLIGVALFMLLVSSTAANPLIWLATAIVSLAIAYLAARTVTEAIASMVRSLPGAVSATISGGTIQARQQQQYQQQMLQRDPYTGESTDGGKRVKPRSKATEGAAQVLKADPRMRALMAADEAMGGEGAAMSGSTPWKTAYPSSWADTPAMHTQQQKESVSRSMQALQQNAKPGISPSSSLGGNGGSKGSATTGLGGPKGPSSSSSVPGSGGRPNPNQQLIGRQRLTGSGSPTQGGPKPGSPGVPPSSGSPSPSSAPDISSPSNPSTTASGGRLQAIKPPPRPTNPPPKPPKATST